MSRSESWLEIAASGKQMRCGGEYLAVWERWVRMWWFSDEQEHNLDGNWTDASVICSDWLTACWLHLALGFSFFWLLEDLFGRGTTVFEAAQHHNLFCIEYSREWQEGWERRGNLGTALHFFSWVTQEGCGALWKCWTKDNSNIITQKPHEP